MLLIIVSATSAEMQEGMQVGARQQRLHQAKIASLVSLEGAQRSAILLEEKKAVRSFKILVYKNLVALGRIQDDALSAMGSMTSFSGRGPGSAVGSDDVGEDESVRGAAASTPSRVEVCNAKPTTPCLDSKEPRSEGVDGEDDRPLGSQYVPPVVPSSEAAGGASSLQGENNAPGGVLQTSGELAPIVLAPALQDRSTNVIGGKPNGALGGAETPQVIASLSSGGDNVSANGSESQRHEAPEGGDSTETAPPPVPLVEAVAAGPQGLASSPQAENNAPSEMRQPFGETVKVALAPALQERPTNVMGGKPNGALGGAETPQVMASLSATVSMMDFSNRRPASVADIENLTPGGGQSTPSRVEVRDAKSTTPFLDKKSRDNKPVDGAVGGVPVLSTVCNPPSGMAMPMGGSTVMYPMDVEQPIQAPWWRGAFAAVGRKISCCISNPS